MTAFLAASVAVALSAGVSPLTMTMALTAYYYVTK